MTAPLPEPRWRTRATHPRLIVAHSLDQVLKLARIQGGRAPVEYAAYAREHGLSLTREPGRTLEEHRDALQKDVEFYNGRFDAVLYHVLTEADHNRTPQGLPAVPGLKLPWAERSNFLAPQMWFIEKDGVAVNLRAQSQMADQWGGKINLNDYHIDIELLRTEEPTALTGEIYARESVERVIESEQFQERVRNKQLLGMLAPIPSGLDIMKLDFSQVACRVTRAEMVDGVVRGDVELVGPQAEKVREMVYGRDYTFGARIFVGMEKEREDGTKCRYVRNLVTWDIVSAP